MESADLETCMYGANHWSIKDLNGDLDISDGKWDSLFNFILSVTNAAYFKGFRLNFMYESFHKDMEFLSDGVGLNMDQFMRIIFKIKDIYIGGNRRMISQFWSNYEYPEIIFLKNKQNERELMNYYRNQTPVIGKMDGVYILRQSFELNVLWVDKSEDMPFASL